MIVTPGEALARGENVNENVIASSLRSRLGQEKHLGLIWTLT